MIELPIIFMIGPSGVGKSHVSNLLVARRGFVFMDIDIHSPFDLYKLSKEWNAFETKRKPLPLVSALRGRVDSNASGLLLSFPSTRVLSRKHIDAARRVGVRTVLLWGPYEVCKHAALGRQDGRVTSPLQYDANNKGAFATYGKPEFDAIRVEVPRPEGGYWPDEVLFNRIDAVIDAAQKGEVKDNAETLRIANIAGYLAARLRDCFPRPYRRAEGERTEEQIDEHRF